MKGTLCIVLLGLFLSCGKEEPRADGRSEAQVQKTEKTGVVLVAEAKEKLAESKEKLIQEGKYSCCVKDPCNHCALHEASCDCYKDVQKGEHVCIECFAEWQQGNGAVEGIKKSAVKADFAKGDHGKH